MKNILISLCVFLASYQLGFTKKNESINQTVINVKLVDKDLDKTKVPIIKLQISSYAFAGLEFFKSKDFIYEQAALKEGNIFNVSSPSDVFYMYIYYEGQRIPGGSYYWIDNIYIIKAGGKLTIELDGNDVKFLGAAATIPNIQSQIIKHSYKKSKSDLKLWNSRQYVNYFKKIDKSLDSALQLQLNIIESNKAILGEYYVKLLLANCYGYRYYSQLREYDFELMQNDIFFKTFKKYYKDSVNLRSLPTFNNRILDDSPMFANYIIENLHIQEKITHEEYGPMLPDSCIKNILENINTNFTGIFRDKLLTLFSLRVNGSENLVPFFDGILGTVKTKKYHDLLVSKIKVKENSTQFKSFNLKDETGKLYTLDSFKNKVVVMDFWFTGCENCVILNEVMKPIIKHFSNNSKIQFVSVSIDKSKEQWLKSVQGGKYTHHDVINLYTNGEGSTHDLINYYNITNYPTVFVIKDGLMFSSLPPRPSRTAQLGKEFSEGALKLIEMLEQASK